MRSVSALGFAAAKVEVTVVTGMVELVAEAHEAPEATIRRRQPDFRRLGNNPNV